MRGLVVICGLVGCGRLGFDETAIGDGGGSGEAPRFSGLSAYYAMEDDPSDGEIEDSSGNGHTGACTPVAVAQPDTCPTITDQGRHGRALEFDGVADMILVANTVAFDTPRAFTIAVWIYLTADAANRAPVGKQHGTSSNNSWNFFSNPAETCYEWVATSMATDRCLQSSLPLNTWTHLVERWDGSAASLYIDGAVVDLVPMTEDLLFDNHPVVIGADIDGDVPSSFWPGRIDEIQIYDRALSEAEIQALSAP